MATILVIEDMEDTRETVCLMLQRAGYEVIEAANGKEGLKMIERYDPQSSPIFSCQKWKD